MIVTMATTIWIGVSRPSDCMMNKPVAPKSLRRNPTRNAALASGGKPSHPATSGSPRRMIWLSTPVLSRTNNRAVPSKNSGTTSLRYHSIRASVFITTLEKTGRRMGGSSTSSLVRCPGSNRAASQPTASSTSATAPLHTSIALKETPARIPITTPSCAEQGIARAKSRITSNLSRFVSSTRVVRVAMVTQPSPSTIGSTAFPFSPSRWNNRLLSAANLGRYPESSNTPKARKNVETIGRINARA